VQPGAPAAADAAAAATPGGGGSRATAVAAIVRAARENGIKDPALLVAVAMEESNLNPAAAGDDFGSGPSSFGLFQLHEGGALGSLTPEQAKDPYINASVIARSWARVGGRDLSGPDHLIDYYREVGRGASNEIPAAKARALYGQAQQLVAQYGGGTPGITAG
jgi:hypothetical protein